MDIAGTPKSDLADCGRLVRFFESTKFNEMAPHDELGHAGTTYVLAEPPDSYIAYSAEGTGKIGLKGMEAGSYDFLWFDCVTGRRVWRHRVEVAAGEQGWDRPGGFGGEVGVHISRTSE
jgi:hypothetical protein